MQDPPDTLRETGRLDGLDALDDGTVELVTIVIPARDEEAFIDRCLDSVLSQTHRALQVIVVDGASRDRTADIVRERARVDPRLELLENPAARIPISLNMALAAARARWLVRIDAHATVPDNYVALALEHLRTGRWGGVGGRKDGVGVTPAGHAVAAAMGSLFGVGNSAYHYATEPREVDHIPFGAYPVELARRLGGWDERLTVNQDFEFDHRVRSSGHPLLFDPRLTIGWHCRQSVWALFRQYQRYGRGKVRVARLHPDSVQLRHGAAPVLLLSWIVGLLLALTGRSRESFALFAPYALGLAVASVRVASSLAAPRSRARVPAAFVAMHAGWAVGFWDGVLREVRGRVGPVVPRPRRSARSTAGWA